MSRPAGRRRGWPADLATTLVITSVVLGPLLVQRGYVLRGDMVFVPDQPWKDAWLGLDGRVPRFVPGDALLSAMGSVLPGDLVQRLLLVAAFVTGGLGAGRLVRRHHALARQAAVVLFLWNPWVDERLGVGQWPVVVGCFLLPWVVLAVETGRWAPVVSLLGLTAIFSPASGLVAAGTAVALTLARGGARRALVVLVVGTAANLPWILPALLRPGGLAPAPGQFAAFGARAESPLGTVASVVSLGGVWKSSIVPGERTNPVVVAVTVVLTVVALAGLVRAARHDRRRVVGLGLAGGAGLLLALVGSVPAASGALDAVAAHLPAIGLLRDTHRFLAPFLVVLLPGVASATAWLLEQASAGREALRLVALLLVVAPVLSLPSLAWGRGGDWEPVQFPAEWHDVRRLVPGDARTVVLPWLGSSRGYAWNDRHSVLDPAQRFLPGEVLLDDRLVVDGRTLPSEDALLDDVRRALAAGDPVAALRRLGVDLVLVEKDNGPRPPSLPGARSLHDGPGLRLLQLGDPSGDPSRAPGRPAAWERRVVLAADVLVALAWLAATGLVLSTWRDGRPGRVV